MVDDKNYNVVQYLDSAAASIPNKPALVPPGEGPEAAWSFLELAKHIEHAVSHMQRRGIAPGTRTLVMVKPGLELIVTAFALLKAGAVPIVIDPGMGLRGFLKCVKRSQAEALMGIRKALWLRRLFPKSFSAVKVEIRAHDLIEAARKSSIPATTAAVSRSKDDIAAILFTSGSTGPAKGVQYTHGMFHYQLELLKSHFRISQGEIDLPLLPVFALFNPALGMCTVVPEINPSRPAKVKAHKIVSAVQRNRVSNSFGSPTLWHKITHYCESQSIQLGTLKRILMAGAPASPELIKRMQAICPNATIHTPYGATEALPICSITGDEILSLSESGHHGNCVGKPLEGIEVAIIRPRSGTISSVCERDFCKPFETGEVIVSGKVVSRAYDALPNATERAKIPHAQSEKLTTKSPIWHRMGDLAYFDAEGRLWFQGRHAERVYTANGSMDTAPVEAVFNKHSRVYRSALIGIGKGKEQVPAIVIEPMPKQWPRNAAAKREWECELLDLAQEHAHTKAILSVYFIRKMPVDVRHNAKIHRLSLSAEFTKRLASH